MLITALQVRGFRSIREISMKNMGRAVIFYGRNGSGKSNILGAIRALFGVTCALARQGLPEAPQGAVGVADVISPADFRVQGDGIISLGATLNASAGEAILLLDGQAVTRLEIRVSIDMPPSSTPRGWCSKLSAHVGTQSSEINLADLLHGKEQAIPRDWPLSKETDKARQRERLTAIANSIQAFLATKISGTVFRTVQDVRHFNGQAAEARRTGDVVAMLAAGDLKGAFAAAHQHVRPEIRDRFVQFRNLLTKPPLSLPQFEPVRPADGNVDIQTRVPGGGAVSIDLSGLGVRQIFYIVASIALEPVEAVAVEEPEAHLHAPTSGRALRQLLVELLDEGMAKQLFIATHSNLFDLDPDGYWHTEIAEGVTSVERLRDLASIDRDHLYEPGPAKHALEDVMRVLPGSTIVAHLPGGRPVTAAEMVLSLQRDDDVAAQFCQDVVGAAVRAVRVKAKSAK